MAKSTTIVAFDQHAATTAAVLLPGRRTPALHRVTSESPTIRRFAQRLRPRPFSAATKPVSAASISSLP
jgi:hypothetical protein